LGILVRRGGGALGPKQTEAFFSVHLELKIVLVVQRS
jgi:hypothetical protein